MIEDCTAIILAGGDSRRMGQDKAMLDFDGQPLIQAVIASMQPLFVVTLVSVRQPHPEISLPQICDVQPQGGPLAGMVNVLEQINTPWVFVVGCDMPFVSPTLVEQLASFRADHQAVVPIVQNKIQPLVAFYSSSCIATMRANLSLGDRSLLGVLRQLDVCYMEEGELLRADPQLRSFFDLDTPEDLAKARDLSVRGMK